LLSRAFFVRTLGLAMFRFGHLGLIDVRLQGDAFARRNSRGRQGTSNRITPANSCCNFFCEFLAVGSSLGIRSFSWVCEETAFHQHCRNVRLSQYVVTTAPHSAIGRRRAPSDKIMDG